MTSITQVINRINFIKSKVKKINQTYNYQYHFEKNYLKKTESNPINEVKKNLFLQKTSEIKNKNYSKIIEKASKNHVVPKELIHSVIRQESNYNPFSISHKGAMGLMQLMPQTAKQLNVSNPFSPEENIMAGTEYLKKMLNQYDGDLLKALAAYNAGPKALSHYNDKIPPYKETQNYVKKVVENYLKNSGINETNGEPK